MSGKLQTVQPDGAAPVSRQRLDKFLWFARIVKTRTLATKLVTGGSVRVNSQRITNAAKQISPGDVLTIAVARDVRVLKVLDCGKRRGPFEEAKHLYEDMAPKPAGAGGPAGATSESATDGKSGDPRSSRPDKRERRAAAQLKRFPSGMG